MTRKYNNPRSQINIFHQEEAKENRHINTYLPDKQINIISRSHRDDCQNRKTITHIRKLGLNIDHTHKHIMGAKQTDKKHAFCTNTFSLKFVYIYTAQNI